MNRDKPAAEKKPASQDRAANLGSKNDTDHQHFICIKAVWRHLGDLLVRVS
jgi:hypothetical protein